MLLKRGASRKKMFDGVINIRVGPQPKVNNARAVTKSSVTWTIIAAEIKNVQTC